MAPLPAPSTSTSQQHTAQQPLPLRRATYVHVSDLISAYNIDHGQLDKEIARVNAKSSQVRTSTSTTTTTSSSSSTRTRANLAALCVDPRNFLVELTMVDIIGTDQV
mmetsp:Transcript_23587/g.51623  ORF Transcript_23587/g.51623 Transcript_23587/m.51623 type:complete len:107 (+) Transcript_23587:211-531(+)